MSLEISRHVVERALSRLASPSLSPLDALEAKEQLELILEEAPLWMSPGLASRIAAVLSMPAPSIPALEPGEALLLAVDPASNRGRVLRAHNQPHKPERAPLTERAQAQARRALRALSETVYASGHAWPEELQLDSWVHIRGLSPAEQIDEESLGLAIAIAELSRAIRRAPRVTVAATARVERDGTLHRVAFVREKAAALRAEWPDVRELVVAQDTPPIDDLPEGITLVRLHRLDEAIARFGLSLDKLPTSSIELAERVEAELERASRRAHSADDWAALADRAADASIVLAADGQRDKSLRTKAWAALFRVHAGRSYEVDLRDVESSASDAAYDPRVLAAMAVSRATAAIDTQVDECVRVAESALERARACGDHAIIARALGTLGRAHTHAGAPSAAEPWLREAIERWNKVDQPQVAQTMCYLATCLRRSGSTNEALAVAKEAIDRCSNRRSSPYAHETERYAYLELARCQQARGLLDEATVSLSRVLRESLGDTSYPNIGALATRCAVALDRGDEVAAAEDLARCLRVATETGALARTALQAVASWLLSGRTHPSARERWMANVGPTDRASLEREFARWVY